MVRDKEELTGKMSLVSRLPQYLIEKDERREWKLQKRRSRLDASDVNGS
jgi:hypothetical protein